MQVLSKGWKKPETGDFGDTWFVALEDNIERSNSHSHNGLDSERISTVSLIAEFLLVNSADFADQGDGYHRALVTIPSGALLDNLAITCKDPTTKDQIYLPVAKVTATTFYVYTNTVQDVEVYFGV